MSGRSATPISRIIELKPSAARASAPQATYDEAKKLPWLRRNSRPRTAADPRRPVARGNAEPAHHRRHGIGNDKQGRNVPSWNNLEAALEDLTKAGFPPESIDTVLCTHLHVDHVGWNTKLVGGNGYRLTKARFVSGRPSTTTEGQCAEPDACRGVRDPSSRWSTPARST